ncbi:MAG: hypothetical protein C0508_19760 [Cyanobacteria bacterium PR.023]|jgi:hypothetical protein|nr:hypothetical protein [Cyanobacteria bacterium PR.023]MDQ5934230.1 hypothetical protein [Cyanobacteriota bacterium erpe_2018_sw_21hr_WHONDRS-SW48-000092_B_bin.40]
MQNELTNLVSDASKDAKAAQPTDASARLMEAALTFYPCKNGALVQNPRDCDGTMLHLPELTIG